MWRPRRYSGELGDAACLAVSGGCIAVLHHALEGSATLTVRAIEAAARAGHLDMVKHLVDHFEQEGVAWDDTEGAWCVSCALCGASGSIAVRTCLCYDLCLLCRVDPYGI